MEYYTMTTGSVLGPAGTGGQQTWHVCKGCGALVADTKLHDDFHAGIGDRT